MTASTVGPQTEDFCSERTTLVADWLSSSRRSLTSSQVSVFEAFHPSALVCCLTVKRAQFIRFLLAVHQSLSGCRSRSQVSPGERWEQVICPSHTYTHTRTHARARAERDSDCEGSVSSGYGNVRVQPNVWVGVKTLVKPACGQEVLQVRGHASGGHMRGPGLMSPGAV